MKPVDNLWYLPRYRRHGTAAVVILLILLDSCEKRTANGRDGVATRGALPRLRGRGVATRGACPACEADPAGTLNRALHYEGLPKKIPSAPIDHATKDRSAFLETATHPRR